RRFVGLRRSRLHAQKNLRLSSAYAQYDGRGAVSGALGGLREQLGEDAERDVLVLSENGGDLRGRGLREGGGRAEEDDVRRLEGDFVLPSVGLEQPSARLVAGRESLRP